MLETKIKPYAKAYAALIGALLTAVLGTVTPDDPLYRVLTIAAALCTAVATWAVENVDVPEQEATGQVSGNPDPGQYEIETGDDVGLG